MNEMIQSSTTIGIVISILAYEIGVMIRKKTRKDFFNPLLIAIVLVIAVMQLVHIDYPSYQKSAQYLSYLLTPATVSLAIPLYQQMGILKKHFKEVMLSVFAGTLTGLCCILFLSILFRLNHAQYITLLPKSITTAIGIGISEELGGFTTITVAAIIVTGIFGNVIAESMFRLLTIRNPLAKGLALGTASHAVGTAKAMEMGEIEGAMSSLAIVVCGIMTVMAATVFSAFY